MAPVKVMLLGPPRVEHDRIAVAFDTRKAMALLADLALSNGLRPRDVLAELLWPGHDTEHARGALRRTLSAPSAPARSTRRAIAWRSCAAAPGSRSTSTASAPTSLRGGSRPAAERFRGEFLEGFGLRDAPAFEDWQRGEADALRREAQLHGVTAPGTIAAPSFAREQASRGA